MAVFAVASAPATGHPVVPHEHRVTVLGGGEQFPVVHHRDVGTGTADVETDRVPVPAQFRDVLVGDRPGGESRCGETGGELLHDSRRHHPAPGMENQEIACVTTVLERFAEASHTVRHQG